MKILATGFIVMVIAVALMINRKLDRKAKARSRTGLD
jgi:preprotein translocase subunit SecG